MCGLPDDDADAMKRTYDFLVKYNLNANIYPMFAYPNKLLKIQAMLIYGKLMRCMDMNVRLQGQSILLQRSA